MPTVHTLIEHLRRAVTPEGDGELLGRFVESRDERALAGLVERHGPMVWGVCRRLLSHHDAEDAFQATFIVLVRKAGSVKPRQMVGNWLYGVARQAALQVRGRRRKEVQVTQMPDVEAPQDQWADVRPILDEELSRLPDHYRAVIVLSDLEGRTRKDIAVHLGIPEGSVASRLARARAMLAKRLIKRGVALSGGAMAAVLSQNAGSASVPAAVMSSTIKAASLCGQVSVKVAALAEGVLKTMLLTKLKSVMAVLVVLAMVAFGGGLLLTHYSEAAPQSQAPKPDPIEPAPKPREGPLGMKFVHLSKGTFYMGWDGTKGSAKKTEIKADYEIAVHTVTQGQWQAIMGNNPSWYSRDGGGKDAVKDIKDEDLKQFPVEQVSWNAAQEFIKKLNEKEKGKGWTYRLPSEAEWEYACRGGSTSEEECSYHFYFAKPTNDLSSKEANFKGEWPDGKAAKGPYLGRTTKVGSYPPNKLGLYDMHGNVWQWCEELYDPKDLLRVLRGGGANDLGERCRSAFRAGNELDSRFLGNGFRLAAVPELKESAKPAKAFTEWGKEVDGLQMGLAAVRTVRQGEKMKLAVKLRNVGKAEIKITYGAPQEYPPQVTTAGGAKVSIFMPPQFDNVVIPTEQVIKPGETIILYNPAVVVESEARARLDGEMLVDTPTICVEPGKYKIAYGGMIQSHPKLATATVEFEVKAPKNVTKWGKEVDGAQVGIQFSEDRVYKVGETVTLIVRLRNNSKKDVPFIYDEEYFQKNPPLITDADGKAVKIKERNIFGIMEKGSVAPEKEVDLCILPLDLRPGTDQKIGEFWTLYGTGKFHIQYKDIPVVGEPRLDAPVTTHPTGTLELEVKEAQK